MHEATKMYNTNLITKVQNIFNIFIRDLGKNFKVLTLIEVLTGLSESSQVSGCGEKVGGCPEI